MLSKPSITYPFLLIREDGKEVWNTRINRAMSISFCDDYFRVLVRDAPRPQRSMRVHILVAEAFHGPRPLGLCALHRDDVKTNNHASNIYWGTRTQNMADRRVNNPQFAVDASLVAELRACGDSIAAIARTLNVTKNTVRAAIRRQNAGSPPVREGSNTPALPEVEH